MAIKITKKQEYVDDVPQEVSYEIVQTYSGKSNRDTNFLYLCHEELLELKEALNNLDIK